MPFLNGEVGGISKHVPAVQKERVVRVLVSNIFLVSLIYFFYSRFAAIRFIVSSFWRERRLRRMYVYVYIYTHVLACTSIYVHVVGSFW